MSVQGRDVLMLAGANYLDLAGDARVRAAAREAIDRYGAAAGGARLISGNLDLHEALEAELARFLGFPSALLFSTGYMANLGVLTALCGPEDSIVSDSLNHASIIDACKLSGARTHVFAHNSVEDFERVARSLPARGRRLLIVDGVYSMDGDRAALEELVPVARRHGFWVLIDDAHGIGTLGSNGRGAVECAGVEVDALIGNLGKAFGSFGAFVAASQPLRDWLVNRARSFIFTCALAPAAVAAGARALEIVKSEPERRTRLTKLCSRLRDGLRGAGFDLGLSDTHIVPVIVGESRATMQLCEAALERGYYMQGIRYPSVAEGTARLRLTPTCAHTEADIEACVQVLVELRDSLLPAGSCMQHGSSR